MTKGRALAFVALFLLFRWLEQRRRRRVSLRRRLVVVTGAGSGVGRQIALQAAARGAAVAAWDLNAAGLAETASLAAGAPGSVRTRQVDVSDRAAVYAAAAAEEEAAAGPAFAVVNNAGIVSGGLLLETADERIEKVFGVNALAHFWTAKAFLPGMLRADEGHIIGVSSVASYFAAPRMVDYAASKYAARGFANGLRAELAKLGSRVRAHCVCPGHISTGLFKGFSVRVVPSMTPQYVARRCLQVIDDGDAEVIIPMLNRPGPVLQALLPTAMGDWMARVLGTHSAMDKFDPTAANRALSMMGPR